jgi:tetratricopeptide (TPR) repeat protein
MLSTIMAGADMHVALPTSEREPFKKAIGADFNAIMKVLVALDARKAEATNPADKQRIFEVVETQLEGSFVTLNNTVKSRLREWYLQAAVAMAEETEDAEMLYNVGAVLRTVFGDHDKSLELLERCLAIRLATLGEKHPYTAGTYDNMGGAYDSKGDYDKALEYHGKALAIKLATLGEGHPDTANTYNNMGNAYNSKGDYDKALEYYGKALAIKLATLGEKHPSTADTYNNMGNAYDSKGDCDKALEYHGKALAIKLATLGEGHPSTAMTYNNMGNAYDSKGDYDKALEYYGKDLAITLATLGEGHPDTAATYNNMGISYKSKGDHDKALEYHGKALAIFKAALGDDHPHTRKVQRLLADLQSATQGQESSPVTSAQGFAGKAAGKAAPSTSPIRSAEQPDRVPTTVTQGRGILAEDSHSPPAAQPGIESPANIAPPALRASADARGNSCCALL